MHINKSICTSTNNIFRSNEISSNFWGAGCRKTARGREVGGDKVAATKVVMNWIVELKCRIVTVNWHQQGSEEASPD